MTPATTRPARPGASPAHVGRSPRRRPVRARAAAEEKPSQQPLASSTRRASLLLAAGTVAALAPARARAAVTIPDPLSSSSAVDALELDIPLRLVALRGAVPGESLAGFKAALGRRGGGVSLAARPQLASIFSELADPTTGGAKSAATADAVTLGDEWLEAAVARGLVTPIPGAALSPWWARLHPAWRRLVTRGADGRIADAKHGGRAFAAPLRWGGVMMGVRQDRLQAARAPVPREWSDLLHPSLAGRVALPSSPRLFAALACAAAGVGLNPTARDLEAALGSSRRGDKGGSAVAALAANMAALRRAALLVSDRDAGRALAAGDAWVVVGATPDLLPLDSRSAAVTLAAPPSGIPLWADLWCVPALAASGGGGRGAAPGTPSPLLTPWLDFCLSPGRADAGRGFGAMNGGASPLVLPPAEVGKSGGLFRRSSPPPPPPAEAATALGPGALPPSSTLARSQFLEPLGGEVGAMVREALVMAGR